MNLVVFEDEEKGLYEVKLEFPPEYRRVNFENQTPVAGGFMPLYNSGTHTTVE